MQVDPAIQLRAGALILDPLLVRHGFAFGPITSGDASGGPFAQADYVRDDRRLELHYRWGLGIVRYHVGEAVLEHLPYMKLLGVYRESAFASNQLDGDLEGFRLLSDDLARFGSDFLAGDGRQFRTLAARFTSNPTMFSGFQALDG